MKLNQENSEVLTNSKKESKFTINASAQAFKILSDGLYEHKIAAIVRELSCNAYDAHVEGGNSEEPFKVVLPNNLHPYFEIEDYGIGLDDDGVREVYTSYFTSTKNDSNDAIGAFGLGSKTPFSYTTNFNIRARKDGIERVYSAYIGQDGSPAVNMLIENKTDEPNGVKITVPVKEQDFNRFKSEAKFILSFFKVQPIVPDPTFEVAIPGIADELEEKGIVTRQYQETGSSLYAGKSFAVMGGVCYRLDEFWIRQNVQDPYLHNIVMSSGYSFNRPTLFVRFDIGDLEVAANRETLSMDDDTRNLVISRIQEKIENLKVDDQKEIDAQGHPILALKYVIDKYSLNSMSYGIFDYAGTSLKKIAIRTLKLSHFYDAEKYIDTRTYSFNKKKVSRYGNIDCEDIALAKSIVGVYYEPGQKKSALIKHSRANTPERSNGILLSFGEPLTERKRERIEKYIGRDIEWLNLQDLKDEEKANKPSITTGPANPAVKLQDHVIRAPSISYDILPGGDYIGADRIDLNDGNHYFWATLPDNRMKWKLMCSKGAICTDTLMGQIFKEQGYDLNETKIVIRNGQNEKKIEKNNVPNISEVLEEFFKDNYERVLIDEIKNRTDFVTMNFVTKIIEMEPKKCKDKYKEMNDIVDVKRFIDVKGSLDVSGMGVRMGRYIEQTRLNNDVDKFRNAMDSYLDMLYEKYPMIKFVSSMDFSSSSNRIEEYIDLIDSSS